MIYLFSCRTCGKQYTGKTTDRFRYRWSNYKMEARKTEKGDMENKSFYKFTFCRMIAKVLLIDKTQGSDPTKRECYWMRTIKTLYPADLNIERDY